MAGKIAYMHYVSKDMYGWELWRKIKPHKFLPALFKKDQVLKITVEVVEAGNLKGKEPGHIIIDECSDTKLPKEAYNETYN